eukprot:TRINITY_DN3174_c1_g1_i16.p1 TRINITY_DN3174_c1_g1~~TRINITY_DN3174_c1_g1_i16.p1  ORF type:complete len:1074 (-),score=308.67 TRINITY_DN3174_c1_g1_i16:121-3342(-)
MNMGNTPKYLQIVLSDCRFPKPYNFFLGVQLLGGTEINKFRTEVNKESSNHPIFAKNCFSFEFNSNIEEPILIIEAFVVLRGSSDSNSQKTTGTARPYGSTSLNLKNSLNDLQREKSITRTINLFRASSTNTKVVGELSVNVQIINGSLPVPVPVSASSSRQPNTYRKSLPDSNDFRTVRVFVFGASNVHGETNPPVSFVTLKSTHEMRLKQRGSATTRLVEGREPSFNMNLFVPVEELGGSQANDLFIGLVSPNTKKLLAKTTIPISGLIHGHQLNLAIPLDSVVGQYSTKLFCSLTLVETAQSEIQVFEQDSTLNRLEIHLYSLNNAPSMPGTVVACLHIGSISSVPRPELPFDEIDPTFENFQLLNDEHKTSFQNYHQIGQTVRLSNSKFRQRFVFVAPSNVVDNNSVVWIGWYYRREDTEMNSENMGYFLAGVSHISLQNFSNIQLLEQSTGIEIPLPKLAVKPVGVWAKSTQFSEISVAAKIKLKTGSNWLKYLQSNVSSTNPLSSRSTSVLKTSRPQTTMASNNTTEKSFNVSPQNHMSSNLSISSIVPLDDLTSFDSDGKLGYQMLDSLNNNTVLDSSRTTDFPNTDISTFELQHTLETSVDDLGPIIKGETISVSLNPESISRLFMSLQSDQEERELPYEERIHELLTELDGLTQQLKHSEESYEHEKERRMKMEADLEKYTAMEKESGLLMSIPKLEELATSKMSKEDVLNVYGKVYSSYEALFSEFTRLKTLQMNFNNISITKNIIEKKYIELQQEYANLQNIKKMENLQLNEQLERATKAMKYQENIIEQYETKLKESQQSQLALQARARQQIKNLAEKITYLSNELEKETDKRKKLVEKFDSQQSTRVSSANPNQMDGQLISAEFQKKYRGHIESLERQIEMLSVQRIKDEQVINTLKEELERKSSDINATDDLNSKELIDGIPPPPPLEVDEISSPNLRINRSKGKIIDADCDVENVFENDQKSSVMINKSKQTKTPTIEKFRDSFSDEISEIFDTISVDPDNSLKVADFEEYQPGDESSDDKDIFNSKLDNNLDVRTSIDSINFNDANLLQEYDISLDN